MIVIIVVGLLVLGLLQIAAFVSTLTTPGPVWRSTGQSKVLWAVVVLLVPLAWIVYLVLVRPKLRDAVAERPALDGGRGRRPWGTYLLYLITALGLLYLFVPLITIAVFSFNQPASNYNTSWNQFTWENWRHVFAATDYRAAFVESIKVAIIACSLATALGALVAIALARYRMQGGAAINLLLVLPLTTPEIVLGASTFTLFFNQGVGFGFWTIVVAHTMFCLSFVALTVKARLRGLDWSLEDAAADLGSPPLRTFFKVTFPMIIPGIAAAFMLSVSLSIDDYIITSFVAGQVSTFPREIWDSYIREVNPQVHAITTLIMVVVLVILLASTMIGKRRRAKLSA